MRLGIVGALAAMVVLLLGDTAAAERPRADLTPDCVDRYEYEEMAWLDTKKQIDAYLGTRGTRVLLGAGTEGIIDSALSGRLPRYVRFAYPSCSVMMYVIYERPNVRHPHARTWVEASYL